MPSQPFDLPGASPSWDWSFFLIPVTLFLLVPIGTGLVLAIQK